MSYLGFSLIHDPGKPVWVIPMPILVLPIAAALDIME
jgi:hypothetical protein